MHQTLLFFHSFFRWFVLLGLLASIYRAFTGYRKVSVFSRTDHQVRHWTATMAHVQLMLGMMLYFTGPPKPMFFSSVHLPMMITSIVLITLGSAFSKRKLQDQDKYKTILIWYGIALLLILAAIPWPFSPLAQRPFIRPI